jgi:hypothetical protein
MQNPLGSGLTFAMQVDVFKLVIQRPRSPLFEKGLASILCRHQVDMAVKLFALDGLFDDISIIVGDSTQHDVPLILDLFSQYSLMMSEAASKRSPWEVPWLCALFQFKKKDKEIRIDIRRRTFLFNRVQASKTTGNAGGSLLLGEFVENMKRMLEDRLRTRTLKKERIFAKHSVFNPYIWFVSDENGQTCSRQDNGNWINHKVRVHLQRIMILDTYSANANPSAWMKYQR